MPFKKGQSGNANGRKPGSLNEITTAQKNFFANFSYKNAEKLQAAFDQVLEENPAEALKIYLQFSERVVGKVSSSTIDITSGGKTLTPPAINVYGSPPKE